MIRKHVSLSLVKSGHQPQPLGKAHLDMTPDETIQRILGSASVQNISH